MPSKYKLKYRLDDEDTDDESFDEKCLYYEGNHIYFYTSVNTQSCSELNRMLTQIKKDSYETCHLHICSPGGELLPCLAVYDRLRRMQDDTFQVSCSVEGCVASAASVIALGCNHIVMGASSFFLIHQLTTGAVLGPLRVLHEEVKNSSKFENGLKHIYLTRTNLTEKELQTLFNNEVYLNAEECLDKGIVDEVY